MWSVSGYARSVGRVVTSIYIGRPTVIPSNRHVLAKFNYRNALSPYPGSIHAMDIVGSVPYWRGKVGQSSRKQVQRIPAERGVEKSSLSPRISRQGVSTGLPTQAIYRNHVWTWDFIFDRTDKGSTLKMLTMLNEFTRQCVAIRVERQIRSE